MPDRRATLQLLLSLAIAALAIAIAIPAWRRVPSAYALPLLLSGALLGMSLMRAEIALRQSRR
ncbi:MAG: hypothetical protein ABR499_07655 [Gemmatimonadaceae bacterium]